MLKQGRCNDDGYSLLEVMTVLVLVGLVVGLASGAFSFVVNAYSRGSEQARLQQEARAVAIFLERELVYSKRLAATQPNSPRSFRVLSWRPIVTEMRFWWMDSPYSPLMEWV